MVISCSGNQTRGKFIAYWFSPPILDCWNIAYWHKSRFLLLSPSLPKYSALHTSLTPLVLMVSFGAICAHDIIISVIYYDILTPSAGSSGFLLVHTDARSFHIFPFLFKNSSTFYHTDGIWRTCMLIFLKQKQQLLQNLTYTSFITTIHHAFFTCVHVTN